MIATIARTSCLLLALVLGACGGRDEPAKSDVSAGESDALPAPVPGAGVTGTADIAPGGQGQVPSLGGAPPPIAPLGGDLVIQELPPIVNPETGLGIDPDGDGPLTAPPAADTGAVGPTAAEAVSVVRDYYAAINARDYSRAHGLWSGNGSASGQSPQQFAAGFAQTQGVLVELGAPGREDAGAGQRYVEVPVAVRATQADGTVRRYAGSYVLQRTVVDGATTEQRSWRIRSADLREGQP
jgi:hypothetical protein